MKPALAVIGLTLFSCLVGAAIGIPRDSLFFFAGGTTLFATLATIALDRYVLTRYEHQLFRWDPGCASPLHLRLKGKIHNLDRWGLFVTIGLMLYSLLYAGYLVARISEEVLNDLLKVLRHI
jgi:hypothetical protein